MSKIVSNIQEMRDFKASSGQADCQSRVTRLCPFPWTLARCNFNALRTKAGTSFQKIHGRDTNRGWTELYWSLYCLILLDYSDVSTFCMQSTATIAIVVSKSKIFRDTEHHFGERLHFSLS